MTWLIPWQHFIMTTMHYYHDNWMLLIWQLHVVSLLLWHHCYHKNTVTITSLLPCKYCYHDNTVTIKTLLPLQHCYPDYSVFMTTLLPCQHCHHNSNVTLTSTEKTNLFEKFNDYCSTLNGPLEKYTYFVWYTTISSNFCFLYYIKWTMSPTSKTSLH